MNNKEWIGWWVVITPMGNTYATDRYKGDTKEKALTDAIATFGKGVIVKAE